MTTPKLAGPWYDDWKTESSQVDLSWEPVRMGHGFLLHFTDSTGDHRTENLNGWEPMLARRIGTLLRERDELREELANALRVVEYATRNAWPLHPERTEILGREAYEQLVALDDRLRALLAKVQP